MAARSVHAEEPERRLHLQPRRDLHTEKGLPIIPLGAVPAPGAGNPRPEPGAAQKRPRPRIGHGKLGDPRQHRGVPGQPRKPPAPEALRPPQPPVQNRQRRVLGADKGLPRAQVPLHHGQLRRRQRPRLAPAERSLRPFRHCDSAPVFGGNQTEGSDDLLLPGVEKGPEGQPATGRGQESEGRDIVQNVKL